MSVQIDLHSNGKYWYKHTRTIIYLWSVVFINVSQHQIHVHISPHSSLQHEAPLNSESVYNLFMIECSDICTKAVHRFYYLG